MAKKLNREGMAAYKQKKIEKAKGLFERAVEADPTMVVAHYNLASMGALLRDVELTVTELRWLKESDDALAAAKLAKARTDPDFVRVSTHPEVRSLIGLPRFETLTLEQKLFEAGDTWFGYDQGCAAAWLEIKLGRDGTASVKDYCEDHGLARFKGNGRPTPAACASRSAATRATSRSASAVRSSR